MSSSEFQRVPRRRRRRRPARRALKLALPFLLLIAVGLLSAGVIRLVETTAAEAIPTRFDLPEEAVEERARKRPNLRQGWGALHTPFESTTGLRLSGDFGVRLDGILPTSFLEPGSGKAAATRDPVPRGEHGFEGPGASVRPQILESDVRLVPEPRTAVLLAMGLGCMSVKRRL